LERNQILAIVVILIVIGGAGVAFIFLMGPTRPPEDTLIWEATGNPDWLDPHIDYDSTGSGMGLQMYETLYTYDWGTDNGKPIMPLLAAAMPVWADDGLSVNVTLRTGITFHDGTPFNASCVKWNFERALKIFYLDGPAWMLAEPILGGGDLEGIAFDEDMGPTSPEFAAAFEDWKENSSAIIVHSETLIQFNLAVSYTPFIDAFSYQVGAQISPTYAILHGNNDTEAVDMDHYGVAYGEYDNPIANGAECGTGPYELAEARPNQYYHFTYFEDYWRADATRTDLTSPVDIRPPSYAGSIKHFYYKINNEVNGRISALRAGTVDGIYLPQPNYDELFAWDTFGVTGHSLYPDDIKVSYGGKSLTVEQFSFNMDTVNNIGGDPNKDLPSPFYDLNMRLCVAYAMNYTAYMATAVNGFGVRLTGIIPEGMLGYVDDIEPYQQNMTKAVEYWNLAMANATTRGYMEDLIAENGLNVYYNTGNLRREVACRVFKDSMATLYAESTATKLTGVTALQWNVAGFEWSVYLDHLRGREMPLFYIGWIPDYADPDNYMYPYAYHRGTYAYRCGYNNSDVNEWYLQAYEETNDTIRVGLYYLIEHQLNVDLPHLNLLQLGELRAYRTWVKGEGLNWNPMYGLDAGYIFHIYKEYPTA
jgi:peptide/nickel transport system substrate-binding protein